MAKAIRYFDKSQTFFDGTEIAAGYYLYQYQAGTTTSANTYTTASKGTANSNPMVLDSDGRLAQDVYIDQSMKFILSDTNAVNPPTSIIFTIDNAVASDQVWATASKTTDYTVLESDRDKLINVDASSAGVTITLLAAATAGDGFRVCIKKVDSSSNAVTIDADGSETIDGSTTSAMSAQYDATFLMCDGSSWHIFTPAISSIQSFLDSNGNEMMVFSTTSSAVNHIQVKNAATGSGPIISAVGDNTNVDLNLDSKGTGVISATAAALVVDNGATGPGEIRLVEDSDNGSNYIGFKAPSSVTSSVSHILPDGAGSSGQFLSTNGSGTLSWVTPAQRATQSAIEAGTDEATYISPDRIKFDRGVAKLTGVVDNNGNLQAGSYNITSVVDTGTGVVTVTIATDFSSTLYIPLIVSEALVLRVLTVSSMAAGSIQINSFDSGGSAADSSAYRMAFFGDFA